jgi:uncharacterized protein (DUF1778 family)
MKSIEMTRFDARLPKEQKEFFEYASKIGGFRSLTEFIIQSVQLKAEKLVEEHNKIIASRKDQEIFFDLVFTGGQPNEELKSALKEYNNFL